MNARRKSLRVAAASEMTNLWAATRARECMRVLIPLLTRLRPLARASDPVPVRMRGWRLLAAQLKQDKVRWHGRACVRARVRACGGGGGAGRGGALGVAASEA